MENEKPQGSYRIENIVLMSSSFHRETNIDFTKPINLNFEHTSEAQETSTDDGKFGVVLSFSFKGMQDQLTTFTAMVKMVGIFEKIGEPPVPEEAFKKINAPAIIYPFIREHIHALCQKGTVGTVLLPTVNFQI